MKEQIDSDKEIVCKEDGGMMDKRMTGYLGEVNYFVVLKCTTSQIEGK